MMKKKTRSRSKSLSWPRLVEGHDEVDVIVCRVQANRHRLLDFAAVETVSGVYHIPNEQPRHLEEQDEEEAKASPVIAQTKHHLFVTNQGNLYFRKYYPEGGYGLVVLICSCLIIAISQGGLLTLSASLDLMWPYQNGGHSGEKNALASQCVAILIDKKATVIFNDGFCSFPKMALAMVCMYMKSVICV